MSEFTHRLPHQPWGKPSRNEEAYFRGEEFKSRMAVAREREARRAQEERRRWIEAHADRCPKCGAPLEAIRTAEAKAEQCPSCLGVWLDHTDFDRLTHPEKPPDDYLTVLLRELLLQYSTGGVTRSR